MKVRERIQNNEKLTLIKYATFSNSSLGRKVKEKEDDIRTVFMIDRDRIIHSKSFRRLKHKTQVYIKTFGDHYRTRLTHTLEVAQIAKTIGKGIGLNEDLIEAIALGHDIGHVPFAHNGEDVLNKLNPNGFRHNENSVRVLTKIEKGGIGLNLTSEVLDGILHHSGFSKLSNKAFTLEGQVVRYSDKIAYVNHDIDDSIRAGLLNENSIPEEYVKTLGKTHGERIGKLVEDCIYNTLNNIENNKIQVSLSDEIENCLSGLRNFMFKNIYNGEILKKERDKAKFVLEQVYLYFLNNPNKMPEFYRSIVEEEGLYTGVTDYIAGMSDDYCLCLFNDLFVPKLVIF
ncbi:deoxyguanosinetriphosphate triphosphohydrolase [Clostridium homopropionicum DSM 5847]|uniref:Deoxyguanosinetriphosphate triphosphohydrolase n=1 Tax=Clostridium homopropionicum DSM 5847 TaxID=1121318 RepID=A0A0L6ZE17_9CLOT|nr:deoxyguanosinetriphosphate triphosphohydrolase [Clostridium homopropionicum]KOA21224.1 deoxyguanosinetriphosphate triphosphohydrolase [Clostridium homopropionicum DSM 5847]SFG27892.1 dGTPase [Clostridium homopropionicum]